MLQPKKNRPFRDPKLLWSRAGRLFIGERLWLDTARTLAVCLQKPALSNTWWPIAATDFENINSQDVARVLALWLNSTFGVISLIAARVDTRGPWVELKKPVVEGIPVLDASVLTNRQRTKCLAAYQDIADKELKPLPEIDKDIARASIDDVFSQAFGFSGDLAVLRRILAEEPLVVGARTIPTPASVGLFSVSA